MVLALLCLAFSLDSLDVVIVHERAAWKVLRLQLVVDLWVKCRGLLFELPLSCLEWPGVALVKGLVDLAEVKSVALVEADVAIADEVQLQRATAKVLG